MGLLDLVGLDPFTGPGRTQRKGNRLHAKGTQSPGTLVGIKYREQADSAADWWFAVTVSPTGTEPFRACCKQSVTEIGDALRLGMPVTVHHDGDDVAISWDGSGPGGWRPARKIADGIDDARARPPKGETGEATVLGFRLMTMLGLTRRERDVRVDLDGAERRIKVAPPEWASHLLAPGTTWPVAVKGDRVDVDWQAALARHGTGVGVATPEPTEEPAPGPAPEERAASAVTSFAQRFIPAEAPGATDEIDAETWLRISAGLIHERVKRRDRAAYIEAQGVPADSWEVADSAWQRRMMSDPELQTRYAAAMQR